MTTTYTTTNQVVLDHTTVGKTYHLVCSSDAVLWFSQSGPVQTEEFRRDPSLRVVILTRVDPTSFVPFY